MEIVEAVEESKTKETKEKKEFDERQCAILALRNLACESKGLLRSEREKLSKSVKEKLREKLVKFS